MHLKLRFAPEVEADLDEAYAWYEGQRSGLGEEFLACVDARLHALCRAPEAHGFAYLGYRRALIRRFPYQVFYELDHDILTVYCVFHTSREQEKWKQRLNR